jgi:ribonuclease HII
VIFPPGEGLKGVNDSKLVAEPRRTELAQEIRARALAFAVIGLESEEIDRLNIYRAAREAMRRALLALAAPADYVLLDGRGKIEVDLPQEAIVKGDRTCHAIAAASILAKTARDACMTGYDERYPGYEFAAHKGYATAAHRAAIRRLGPCPIHRRSFLLLPHPRLFD